MTRRVFAATYLGRRSRQSGGDETEGAPPGGAPLVWLGYLDSNQGCRFQRPMPYRLAIPQRTWPMLTVHEPGVNRRGGQSISVGSLRIFQERRLGGDHF